MSITLQHTPNTYVTELWDRKGHQKIIHPCDRRYQHLTPTNVLLGQENNTYQPSVSPFGDSRP
eukprot:6948665-Prymnesium_polylepis.1